MILLGRDGLKSSRMSRLKEALAKMKLQRRLLRKIEDAILNDRHGRLAERQGLAPSGRSASERKEGTSAFRGGSAMAWTFRREIPIMQL